MPAPLARRTPTDVEPIEQLVESARRYIEEGKAKSTRRAYRSSFAGFDGWCRSRGLVSCPAAPATVAVYLAALADAGAAVSTIERTLAGIAHEHRSRNYVWQRGEPAIRETPRSVLSAGRRPPPRTRRFPPACDSSASKESTDDFVPAIEAEIRRLYIAEHWRRGTIARGCGTARAPGLEPLEGVTMGGLSSALSRIYPL